MVHLPSRICWMLTSLCMNATFEYQLQPLRKTTTRSWLPGLSRTLCILPGVRLALTLQFLRTLQRILLPAFIWLIETGLSPVEEPQVYVLMKAVTGRFSFSDIYGDILLFVIHTLLFPSTLQFWGQWPESAPYPFSTDETDIIPAPSENNTLQMSSTHSHFSPSYVEFPPIRLNIMEVLKARMDGALSNLVCERYPCPWQKGWN